MVRTGRKAFGWHEEETLKHTIKQARASLLLVEINQKFIALAVKDDGKGFDTQKSEINTRGGLGNMRERIKMLGGTFQITSDPGHGTAVLIHIPLNFGSLEKGKPEVINNHSF